jgi:predicted amidohydrolase
MKVVGVQADLVWEDPEANCRALEAPIMAAAGDGAGLVVLPEMFPTGFSMAAERIAEVPGGASEQWLRKQAARHGVAVVGSIATLDPDGGKPRNLAVLAHPDGTVERYAKIHPFTFAQEDRHYAAGDQPLVCGVGDIRVAVTICYDLRFGELYLALAEDVDLFVVVANWPEARRDHWSTLLKARSIETMAYVLGVNRVGSGGSLTYTGDSALWAPGGELVAEAGAGEVTTIAGEVDPEVVRDRRARFPVLRDRRVEVYRR